MLRIVVTVLLVALATRAGAQELTVEQSVRMGLESNERLRVARADATAARAVQRQVEAGRLPSVRAQANYTRVSDIPGVEFDVPGLDSTFVFQTAQLDRYHAELSVGVPVLSQIRLGHETRAAEHVARSAELALERERAMLAFEIRRAWWELYRSMAALEAAEAAVVRMDEHVAVVARRVAEGTAITRDLLAAQARRSEVRLERVEAANAVRSARLELNRRIGLPLDAPVQPAVPAEPLVVDTTAVLDEHPQLEALAEQTRARRASLAAATAARLPELDVSARYFVARPNPYYFTDQESFRNTWEFVVSGRWPVWEGGRLSAQRQEARARLEAAEATLADAAERMTVDLARARLELQRASEAVGVAAQNVAEAEESFRVARQQFGEGAALSADVLDAEQALREAQARSSSAEADLAIARAAVLNALGRVW